MEFSRFMCSVVMIFHFWRMVVLDMSRWLMMTVTSSGVDFNSWPMLFNNSWLMSNVVVFDLLRMMWVVLSLIFYNSFRGLVILHNLRLMVLVVLHRWIVSGRLMLRRIRMLRFWIIGRVTIGFGLVDVWIALSKSLLLAVNGWWTAVWKMHLLLHSMRWSIIALSLRRIGRAMMVVRVIPIGRTLRHWLASRSKHLCERVGSGLVLLLLLWLLRLSIVVRHKSEELFAHGVDEVWSGTYLMHAETHKK